VSFTIDLEGRRALVTGAGQGVGRAIALSLARANGHVFVNDIVEERAAEVVDEVGAEGGRAAAAVFSVTDWADVQTGVDALGGVDILVNNAGNAGAEGFELRRFVDTTPDEWGRYFGTNLFGVMHCTRAVLPGMIERGDGRVVTIISDAARFGDLNMAAYAAAKAGAAGFSRSIAREMGRHGITVNNVALGTIRASSAEDGEPETPEAYERLKKMMKPYIVRRRGEPQDIANLVTFLASPLASWITGQTYPVDGGYTLAL
jgi:NAD(P)-dependent dehydrogenase (short-subunit alcohol dehydrogenase family)